MGRHSKIREDFAHFAYQRNEVTTEALARTVYGSELSSAQIDRTIEELHRQGWQTRAKYPTLSSVWRRPAPTPTPTPTPAPLPVWSPCGWYVLTEGAWRLSAVSAGHAAVRARLTAWSSSWGALRASDVRRPSPRVYQPRFTRARLAQSNV